MDNDFKDATGAIYDYGFRIYDSRIGKFLSVDPLTGSYPWYTPYQFAGNSPIMNIDLDGLEDFKSEKYRKDIKYGVSQLSQAHFSIEDRNKNKIFDNTIFHLETIKGIPNVLVNNKNVSPAKALNTIISNPKKFSIDCFEFVKLTQLYALLEYIGPNRFDKYLGNKLIILGINTSRVNSLVNYTRSAPNESFYNEELTASEISNYEGGYKGSKLKEDVVLKNMPIGSNITITNLDAWQGGFKIVNGERKYVPADAFRNENMIKVGDDEWGAHGFESTETYTLKELKTKLAACTGSSTDRIFISRFELLKPEK